VIIETKVGSFVVQKCEDLLFVYVGRKNAGMIICFANEQDSENNEHLAFYVGLY